jgi:hypothetical protein
MLCLVSHFTSVSGHANCFYVTRTEQLDRRHVMQIWGGMRFSKFDYAQDKNKNNNIKAERKWDSCYHRIRRKPLGCRVSRICTGFGGKMAN